MIEQTTSPAPTGPRPAPSNKPCPKVEDILNAVIGELKVFEAQKLNELKSELEAFVRLKDAAVTEYKNKYDNFRTRWCEEGKQIEQIRSDLICAYKDWKKFIQEGVCGSRKTLHKLEVDIKALQACKGQKEKKRDETKEYLGVAHAAAEAWKGATNGIDKRLNDNQALITQIQNLSQGQDRAFRLYLLWFKLLPAHNQLRPDDAEASHSDEAPEILCGECTPEGQQKDQSQEGYSGSASTNDPKNNPCSDSTREPPWIIDKDKYSDKLDCVFAYYKAAKESYAQAESAFQLEPDDLASLIKSRDNKTQSLGDEVKKKLGEVVSDSMTDKKCP
jgi:hypothetical protein